MNQIRLHSSSKLETKQHSVKIEFNICKPIGSILYQCKGLEKYRNQQKSTTSRTIRHRDFTHHHNRS